MRLISVQLLFGKSKQRTHDLILNNGNVIENLDVISQHVRDYDYYLFI